jgi:hypothetical protein
MGIIAWPPQNHNPAQLTLNDESPSTDFNDWALTTTNTINILSPSLKETQIQSTMKRNTLWTTLACKTQKLNHYLSA